ncbi:MAG: hypothetical protein CFE36_14455 [Sphingomonadaceae bacterium PASS1]|nr:MAG: hypothetical protein CFE36_14455 [Sphingomonadaceae bacterium PASS1]
MSMQHKVRCGLLALSMLLAAAQADAHKLHKQGEAAAVADSSLTVTPSRDWNQLGTKIGKKTETWTLDGEQLNDITFFAGIEPGKPLVKEKSKKREPLPKFTTTTLLAEIPELLENTSRSFKGSGSFQIASVEPTRFLDSDGVVFNYVFTDEDQLTRKGEARAAIIKGRLYMITFEAPRLSYYDKVIADFRALADTAKLR